MQSLSLIVLSLLLCTAAALGAPSVADVCSATHKPELCLSLVSPVHSNPLLSPYGYANLFADVCLQRTRMVSGDVERHVGRGRVSEAVQDCRRVFRSNIVLLENMMEELEGAGERMDIEDFRTPLSVLASNHRECVDGLAAEKGTAVMTALTEASDVFDIAVELATQELDFYWRQYRHHFRSQHSHGPAIIDNRHWA